MKLRISITLVVAFVTLLNVGCRAVRGDESSRLRNTNRQAFRGTESDSKLMPVAEAPNTGLSWGGSLSPR